MKEREKGREGGKKAGRQAGAHKHWQASGKDGALTHGCWDWKAAGAASESGAALPLDSAGPLLGNVPKN